MNDLSTGRNKSVQTTSRTDTEPTSRYCPHCGAECRAFGKTDLAGNPFVEYRCPDHNRVENPAPKPLVTDGGQLKRPAAADVLSEWDEDACRAVRAAIINPSRRDRVDADDILRTLELNKGELALQTEHQSSQDTIWPLPADTEGDTQYVAVADRYQSSDTFEIRLTREELRRRIYQGEWSIICTHETPIKRPDAAMEGR